jgi:hypothetical protein
VSPDDLFRLRGEATIAARSGDLKTVERIVSEIRKSFADAATYQYAQIYAQTRQLDDAFASLEKGVEVKDPGVTGLRTDPLLDPIRGDPRYSALVKKLNFPTWT